ncbi:MAG: hypothetical protein ACXABD_18045, partial [Candidatus Thorarchaeota archaeon]
MHTPLPAVDRRNSLGWSLLITPHFRMPADGTPVLTRLVVVDDGLAVALVAALPFPSGETTGDL